MRRAHHVRFVLAATLLVGARAMAAGGGDLDPTFGAGGVLDVRLTNSGGAHTVLPGPGGTLVGKLGNSPEYLYRLLPSGTPDPSFGTDGFVELPYVYSYNGMAVGSDGSIILVGAVQATPGVYAWFVRRFLPSGADDPGFGTGGIVTADLSPAYDEAGSALVQADGRILVAGRATFNTVLARYNTDGSLDPTFGVGGIAMPDIDGSPTGFDEVYLERLLPGGKFLAGVIADLSPDGLHLAQFNSDGSLDTGFGGAGTGIVTVPIGDSDGIGNAAVLPDGRLLVTGVSTYDIPSRDFQVARLLPDGTLDPTFGSAGSGFVTTDFGGTDDESYTVVPLPDGKILLAGRHDPPGPALSVQIGFARYEADGTLDSTFGTGGFAYHPIDEFSQPTGQALLLADGDVIMPGSSFPSDVRNFLVRIFTCGPCDVRSAGGACVTAPPLGCAGLAVPPKARLTIRSSANDAQDTFSLALGRLDATSADFGDPTAGDRLAVCLYTGTPANPTPIARTTVTGGDTCAGVPCWRGLGSPTGTRGYKRSDPDGTSDGVLSALLKVRPAGRSSVKVKARGDGARTPALPLGLPVRARVQAASGACWEAQFGAAGARVNDSETFKGSND